MKGMPMLVQGHDKLLKAVDVLSMQKIPTPEALRRALGLSHSDDMIVRFGNENRAFDREALARMSNVCRRFLVQFSFVEGSSGENGIVFYKKNKKNKKHSTRCRQHGNRQI